MSYPWRLGLDPNYCCAYEVTKDDGDACDGKHIE